MRTLNVFPLLLLLLFSGIHAINVAPSDERDDNPLVVTSEHMDYVSNTVVIRAGKQLMISCVFERDDIADKSDLTWKKEGGRIIDGESSPRSAKGVFTVEVLERHTHFKKTSLHFTAVHERDDGNYECTARTLGGQQITTVVVVKVLGGIQWSDKSHKAGALEGEPLTIDCNVFAENAKEPQIEISSGTGEPLDENIFTIAGNEITVQNLTRDLDRFIVSCIHIEMISKGKVEDYPVVDRKDVRIDVYHKPEFAPDTNLYYAITDGKQRETTLHCNITASNPPAHHFRFYLAERLLNDTHKYITKVDVGLIQGAHLTILNVQEEDLGTYTCEASNGKAKATHAIHLKKANPPPEPKISFLSSKMNSIRFEVKNRNIGNLIRIEHLEIVYARVSLVEEHFGNDFDVSDIDRQFWEKYGTQRNRSIVRDNFYEIHGLRQATGYVWKFRFLSEVGYGNSIVMQASTASENTDKKLFNQTQSAISSFWTMTLFLTILLNVI